jgi:hypothetical protein
MRVVWIESGDKSVFPLKDLPVIGPVGQPP